MDFVLSKKKEAELVFDKIAQEEAEKQFQKVQSIWMKEEAERIELLKQVYKEREEAVNHKSKFIILINIIHIFCISIIKNKII